LARDRFRRKRPPLEGHVRRVAQAADDTTGLFEVEVVLANPGGSLKPGLIGLAHVVVQTVQGFRIPETAVVFREGRAFLFSVDSSGVARQFVLEDWIEEGSDLILAELPPEHRRIVVRGQHRLVDGRAVEEVDLAGDPRLDLSTETTIRTSTTASRP
jgi:multidrug efflux pump subunit AcrA (membrane-fusion protein)